MNFGPLVLEKKMKMWNVYDSNDNDNDDDNDNNHDNGQILIRKLNWAFGSDEVKTRRSMDHIARIRNSSYLETHLRNAKIVYHDVDKEQKLWSSLWELNVPYLKILSSFHPWLLFVKFTLM